LLIDNVENVWVHMTRWQKERFLSSIHSLISVPRLVVVLSIPTEFREVVRQPRYFSEIEGIASRCMQSFSVHYSGRELQSMVSMYAESYGTDINEILCKETLRVIPSDISPGDLLQALQVAFESRPRARIGTRQLESMLQLTRLAA